MSYDFTGRLHRIFDTEQIKDTFQKREFVVEEAGGQYPNVVKFELTQDRCTLIDEFKEGDEVTVSFDLSGRAWNDKFFTNLRAWRIQHAAGGGAPAEGHTSGGNFQSSQSGGGFAPSNNSANKPAAAPAAKETTFSSGETNDDLPF